MTIGLDTKQRLRPFDAEERRIAERCIVHAEISVESDSQFFTGLAGNVSTGGVFVATYRRLPMGAQVALRMTLPEGELLG